jgi:predicted enzyme related to lactoylglutathione lyase
MSEFGLSQIGQIAVWVQDVERATAFYRDVLGLRFLFQFPGMAFFDAGGTRLYLTKGQAEADRASILYYRVDSIQDAYETLRARGVEFIQKPGLTHQDERHQLWLAFANDSEGNHFALMSEVLIESTETRVG